jgi:virginiamycin B lyase
MRKGLPLAVAAVATMLGAACFALPASAATITEFAAVPGSLPGTHITRYVEVGPEGAIWWSENGTEPGIGRITTAGVRLPRIADPDAPADLIRAADGTMYWTGDEGVGRKTPSGAPETVARPGFSEGLGLTAAGAVRWGENVGGTNEGVYRFAGDAWGAAVQAVATAPGSGSVTGMALGPEGHLWVAFPGVDGLRVLDAAGLAVERTVELPPGSGPSRLALGPDGDLWVTMFDADAVDRIAADGSRTRFGLPTGSSPLDIVAGPDGALWFTEYGTDRIGRLTTAGAVSEYAIPTPSTFPIGITAGPDGAIWFAESEAGKIGRLLPEATGPVPGGGGAEPGVSDTTAPRFLRRPDFRPRRFLAAGTATAVSATGVSATAVSATEVSATEMSATAGTRRRGTTLRLDLSEPARVGIRILHGGRRPLGVLRRAVPAGPSRIAFSGRLHGRPLGPGRYRAAVLAWDAAGNLGRAAAAFTVLPLPPR